MVSKRQLTLLGPAVLSFAVWSAGAAQASAALETTGHQGAVVRTLPGDASDDYKNGYDLGWSHGQLACSGKGGGGIGSVSAAFRGGYDAGRRDAMGNCKAAPVGLPIPSTGKTTKTTSTEEEREGDKVIGKKTTTTEESETPGTGGKVIKKTTTTTTEEGDTSRLSKPGEKKPEEKPGLTGETKGGSSMSLM